MRSVVSLFGILAAGLVVGRSSVVRAQGGSGATPNLTPPADVAAAPADARKLPSGLAMKVVVRGKGKQRPLPNDCVRLLFTAWTRTGQVAGTSSDGDAGEVQCLRRILPVLSQTVATMVVGEKRRLWIPEALAFPPDPKEDPPARKTDVTYDLTLMAIIAAPPTPKSLRAPPARARRLPSGVAIEELRRGTGHDLPTAANQITMHLSGWSSDGTLFQSTTMDGHPVTYTLAELVPGLREGVQQMVTGQRARLWIPASLAYGDKPHRRGQPAGNLVFEVELIGLQ